MPVSHSCVIVATQVSPTATPPSEDALSALRLMTAFVSEDVKPVVEGKCKDTGPNGEWVADAMGDLG